MAPINAANAPMVCRRLVTSSSRIVSRGESTSNTPNMPSNKADKRTILIFSPKNIAANIVTINGAA